MSIILHLFQCTSCQKEYLFSNEQTVRKEGVLIPDGWYGLLRGPIYQDNDSQRQIFCSVSCLLLSLEFIDKILDKEGELIEEK